MLKLLFFRSNKKYKKPQINYSQWISQLPEEKVKTPLNNIAIPGSHDSATASINPSSQLSPDIPELDSLSVLGPIGRRFIYRWTRTQELTLREQMDAGIRYLDLRVATKMRKTNKEQNKKAKKGANYATNSSPVDATSSGLASIIQGASKSTDLEDSAQLSWSERKKKLHNLASGRDYDIFFVHGQYGAEISAALTDVREFLNENPKEIVLLDFNHFYFEDDNETAEKEFYHIIDLIFGDIAISKTDHIPSIQDMWMQNKKVIVFSSLYSELEYVWSSYKILSYWPDTVNPEEMLKFLDENYGSSSSRKWNQFSVHQGVLTPTSSYILRNFLFGTVRKLAKNANRVFLNWLCTKEAGSGKINITIIDFVQHSPAPPAKYGHANLIIGPATTNKSLCAVKANSTEDYIGTVIGLNYK